MYLWFKEGEVKLLHCLLGEFWRLSGFIFHIGGQSGSLQGIILSNFYKTIVTKLSSFFFLICFKQFKKDIDEHQFLTESVLQKGEILLQCLLDNTPGKMLGVLI